MRSAREPCRDLAAPAPPRSIADGDSPAAGVASFMRTLLAVVLLVAACSHESTAPARPRPRAMAARTPPRLLVTDADAQRLAADLRAPVPSDPTAATLPRWVAGPVVILDGDTSSVRVACGADAVDSARA